jgi:pimeloyl-ACP methyl ester carboxylesterase
MKPSRNRFAILAMAAALTAMVGYARKPSLELAGVACQTPPPEHCPDAGCPSPTVISGGSAKEPKTGREFFIDYPCGMKKGDKVTFILSLHGFGSYGNWMRHYFPLMDYKDKYHLVIATPNASAPPPKAWAAVDDAYLQNIVDLVYDTVGKENIKAFWLVGHSQGGMTSNRLVRTPYFSQKVDGWLSLSGGRLGENPGRGNFSNLTAPGGAGRAPAPRAGAAATPGRGALTPPPSGLPEGTFSFIYETGQHEMNDKGLPESSAWAQKLGCSDRVRMKDVVDTKAGYVYDSTRQDPGSDGWGRLPRPGSAEVFEYPKCKDGRIVADVVRMSKGHTEGLEPHVTEQLIKLMLSAKK